jgi:ribosomal protein S18 acetylase RimI-like enzyme
MEVVTPVAMPNQRQVSRPIAPAKSSQLAALTELLGRAFINDPLICFLEPNDKWRTRLTPVLYRAVLRYCLRYGQADVTTDGSAVACWLLPSHCQPSLWRELRSGMWALPFRARTNALRRLLQFDTVAKALRLQHAGPAHWYLWTIAVDPSQQSKGHAGTLLRSVLTRADRSGETCYLETQNPANVALYQRFGFVLKATQELAPDVVVHAMRRDPQAVQAPYRRASA